MRRGRTAGCPPYCPPLAGPPEERVAAFVSLARASRRHGREAAFDAPRWDVTDTVARRAGVPATPGRLRAVFEAEGADAGAAAEAMGPFIRSYVGMLPAAGHGRLSACVAAGGLIARAMGRLGVQTLADVNVAVLNEAAALARIRRPGGGTALAGAVREIGAFLGSQGMTHAALAGTLPLPPPPSLPDRYEDAHAARSRRLLPSDRFVDALVEAHHMAESPADVIVTRVALVLASVPGRINEALALDADPEVERISSGVSVLGLRWRGSKGAVDGVKWVVPSMGPAVREACEDLRQVTAEGRRIKAWYAARPGSLYLPATLAHLRGRNDLTLEECGALLGRRPGPGLRRLIAELGATGASDAGSGASFADVEAYLLHRLADAMRDAGGPKASPMLVVPWGTFDVRRRPPCPCMFETVKYRHVADALDGALFRRLGLDPDGEIGGRTHSFRHWLITLALRGNISAAEVAAWAGRSASEGNRAYDHRTAAEMRALVSRASAASRRTTSPLAAAGLAILAGTTVTGGVAG